MRPEESASSRRRLQGALRGSVMIVKLLQRMVSTGYLRSCQRCNDWSGTQVAALRPKALLDVGCADGSFLFRYLNYQPELFHGIEASLSPKDNAFQVNPWA